MALLLRLHQVARQAQSVASRAKLCQAAVGQICCATGNAGVPGAPQPSTPDGSGTVFNTAGAAGLAADPAIPAAVSEPTAAPAEHQAAAGPKLHPSAAVTPAAAAAAVAEAKAAAAAEASAAGHDPAASQQAGAAGAARHASPGGQHAAGGPTGGAAAAEDFDTGELSEEQRDVLATIVREALASEDGAQQLVNAQRTILGGRRPDLATAAEDASAAADILKKLAPSLRARPSLLGPLWGVAGAAAGAAAGLAPRNIADAIRGGAAEALTERYTGHLRRLGGAGMGQSPAAEALRGALRTLRDVPRAPDGHPPVPDLISVAMNQQLPRNMTVSEGVGGLTKLAFQGMFAVASHI